MIWICHTPTLSTASSMMSIHPLKVAIWNSDRYAKATLSKLILQWREIKIKYNTHFPPDLGLTQTPPVVLRQTVLLGTTSTWNLSPLSPSTHSWNWPMKKLTPMMAKMSQKMMQTAITLAMLGRAPIRAAITTFMPSILAIALSIVSIIISIIGPFHIKPSSSGSFRIIIDQQR